MAAALVRTESALKGGNEFLAAGVVLHQGRVSFGIGQHLASRVNDGGASAGGLTFLSGDVLQRMGAIGIHAMSEQHGLLVEVALNLLA